MTETPKAGHLGACEEGGPCQQWEEPFCPSPSAGLPPGGAHYPGAQGPLPAAHQPGESYTTGVLTAAVPPSGLHPSVTRTAERGHVPSLQMGHPPHVRQDPSTAPSSHLTGSLPGPVPGPAPLVLPLHLRAWGSPGPTALHPARPWHTAPLAGRRETHLPGKSHCLSGSPGPPATGRAVWWPVSRLPTDSPESSLASS